MRVNAFIRTASWSSSWDLLVSVYFLSQLQHLRPLRLLRPRRIDQVFVNCLAAIGNFREKHIVCVQQGSNPGTSFDLHHVLALKPNRGCQHFLIEEAN